MFLITKYEQIVKLEHLLCPKVGGGGGGHKLTCAPPPTFESGEARAPPLLLRTCIDYILDILA